MLKQIRVSTRKYTIKKKERKETRHVSVLVWMYNDTNLIMWRCSYICTTRRESLRNERNFFFCVTKKKQGIRPRGFFVYECVCLCVCARVWATYSHYAKRAFLIVVHSLTFGQTSCCYTSLNIIAR